MLVHKNIIIATHSLLYGAPHALRDYLIEEKNDEVLFLEFPLLDQRKSRRTAYKNRKIISEKVILRKNTLGIIDFFIDFGLLFWWINWKKKFDVFVGVDPLNCFAGLIFKKLKKVKKVILYSIDFSPIRFESKILNKIYHWFEIFCVKNADEVWNVSPRIAEGREKFLGISQKSYHQTVVPIGVWNEKIKKIPFKKVHNHEVLFLGHLLEKQGVQKVLESIPYIIEKIPFFKFTIIGGGEYEQKLKSLAKKLKIEKFVEFKGWIREREKIDKILGESAMAVATYVPEENRLRNFTYYADPTKIKDYLASGLPIIITDVSYNTQELVHKKCAILVKYEKLSIAQGIIRLLSNTNLLQRYRYNAIQYAKSYDWKRIFDKAFEKNE